MAEREHWERTGQRHLRFDNGRSESYQAVAVPHEPSGGMWSRILIARDDGTLADRIASLPEIEAHYDSLRAKVEAEVEHLRDAAIAGEGIAASELADDLEDGPGLIVGARANRRTADRLSALLEETGPSGSSRGSSTTRKAA